MHAIDDINAEPGDVARLIPPTLETVRATLSHRFGDSLVAVTALAVPGDGEGAWSVVDCLRCGNAWCLVTRLSPAVRSGRRATTLSTRERMIATQVAAGAPLKIVAATLSISIQAVATYLSRVKRKLGVTSRAELVRAVIFDGALPHGGVPAPAREAPVLFEFIWNGERLRVLPAPLVPPPPIVDRLTGAELDVLIRVAYGMTNAKIARTRGTAATTVASQVSTIMHKAGVSSRAELLALIFDR